jgi:ribulose-bisphosphate carboxylase large chain
LEVAHFFTFLSLHPLRASLLEEKARAAKQHYHIVMEDVVSSTRAATRCYGPRSVGEERLHSEACNAFWQEGDFIKNDEPQVNQVFCQMNEFIPKVVKAMRACVKERSAPKFSLC